jgi:hypothetical protein
MPKPLTAKAAVKYHGEKGYNCAQAVLKAFDAGDSLIEKAKKHGGGRAPDGLCGAIYAGHLLLEDEGLCESFTENFLVKAKSVKCKEIRSSKTLTCSECVHAAGVLLELHYDADKS